MKKLWSGRFSEPADKLAEEFNASISFDKRLALHDIRGSVVHVRMLGRQGIIDAADAEAIEQALLLIAEEAETGVLQLSDEYEDVHTAVEKRLTEIVGPAGGKLHTARSRNDQVALDFRLYMRDVTGYVLSAIAGLQKEIVSKASLNMDAVMPGYTHLQTAQPVLFSHWIMAYFQMLRRDYDRFIDLSSRMNNCPLGAGAIAGTTFPIDREYVAKELGFNAPTANSIDSVSDRDFALEFMSAAAICMMHLSRFSEELILFSSSEFAFIELSEGFCTGSSIMPQKKNPDIPELIRGKTGRVYGGLTGLLVTMKGLPLAYNKDMQEDKEVVFDCLDTLLASLRIFAAMLPKMGINKENMLKAASKGYSTATDLADYLVRKGLPFRQAHNAASQTVRYAAEKGKLLQELELPEFCLFSSLVDSDIYGYITVEASVNNRKSFGGTSQESVTAQINDANKFLNSLK
ncbi:MAG: argininosuccinate lyase [Deferribacteraceae bacterium]|jgi:argininosuccinate lyase|nr:argininosuccinate lyase [Deferribacteraceae bacterium]